MFDMDMDMEGGLVGILTFYYPAEQNFLFRTERGCLCVGKYVYLDLPSLIICSHIISDLLGIKTSIANRNPSVVISC